MAENRALAPLMRDTSPSDAAEAEVDFVEMPPLRSGLSGPAKAAVIVRFLLNEGADLALETLPDDLQARLTDQMANMGLVTRDTLTTVAQEFAEALDGVGLTFPGDLSGALTALDGLPDAAQDKLADWRAKAAIRRDAKSALALWRKQLTDADG